MLVEGGVQHRWICENNLINRLPTLISRVEKRGQVGLERSNPSRNRRELKNPIIAKPL
jgi:hypothetical protein